MKKIIRSILRGLGLYAFALDVENKLITMFKKGERKAFYGQFIQKGDLVFDVGANKGNRTVIFLDLGAKVVAVEPQKECYEHLTKRFGNKIELVKLGLGEAESTATMYVSGSTLISSFSKDHVDMMQEDRFKGAAWGKTIEVKMTTMDKLIEQHGVPAFCKVDVEGYEYDVLKGLSQPVGAMSLEYIVPENTQVLVNCLEHLNKLGQIECNFSYGESMKFNLPTWKTGPEMIAYVQSQEFTDTSYGDVYVRFVK
ncbi:MAG: FkbM family methyltransferase [Flavobacteriales bacterium]|nr:FkbM family methyltransferase [Flavobacteriales bacterium]